MQNYKSPDNSVHALDSDEFEFLLPIGSVKITELEAEKLKPVQVINIDSQIKKLESTITSRRLREAVLGTDAGWLESIDIEIAELRAKL